MEGSNKHVTKNMGYINQGKYEEQARKGTTILNTSAMPRVKFNIRGVTISQTKVKSWFYTKLNKKNKG